MPGPHLKTLTAPDGTVFRDLDRDGVMAPFEDPRLSAEERAEDLLARLSPAEKAGLMFHNVIEMGEGGALLAGDGAISRASTAELVAARFQNHFNVHAMQDVRASCRWYNAIQEVAATTTHSIPVTISSDPRHSVTENVGAGFMAGDMSSWPEPLGLAALHDAERIREFADIVRQEYVAVGIRSALHPQIDLGTEPRWGRQYHTFGNDAEAVADAAQAYVEGLQGAPELGAESVAAMAKHLGAGSTRRAWPRTRRVGSARWSPTRPTRTSPSSGCPAPIRSATICSWSPSSTKGPSSTVPACSGISATSPGTRPWSSCPTSSARPSSRR